jgi:peroxiredoxin Q/BCP
MAKTTEKAPAFCLMDQSGDEMKLKDLKGSWTVLYFYPKDNTSGCTTEAKDFTSRKKDFDRTGAQVIGVSPDSVASHQKFIDKHELGVTLLSDPDHELLSGFNAWVTRKSYGKEHKGVERSTFIIDPKGKVRHEWRKVKVAGHVDEVLETLKELQA